MSRATVPGPGKGVVAMSQARVPGDLPRRPALARRGLVTVALAAVILLASQLAGVASSNGLLPSALAPSTTLAAACINGWRELNLPEDAFSRSLFSVVTYNQRPKWLIGGSHRSGTLVLRKKDGKWKRVSTSGSGTAGFTGGSSITAAKAMVVGYDNPANGQLRAIGGKINTSGFNNLGVPRLPGGSGSTLTDVVALGAKKAWAVGTRWTKGRSRATAVRWNGKSWSRKEPASANVESAFTAVHATPGGKVWAVGWKEQKRGEFRPLIRKRTSTGWRTVKPAALAKGTAILTDVHFASKNKGWIVGHLIKRHSARYQPLLQQWDGNAWNRVTLPWAGDHSMVLRSVTGDGDGNLWLAGVRLPKANAEGRGFVAKFVNDEWSLQELDVPASVPSDLRDIAATLGGAIAVGSVASTTFAMETCGAQAAFSEQKIAVSSIAQRIAAGTLGDGEIEAMPQEPQIATAGAIEPAGLGNPVVSGKVRFEDRAAAAGVFERTKTWSGVVSDVDKDGWMDIWYSRHLVRPPRMLLGSASGFRKAPAQPWTIGDRHGCDAADIDRDGARDIFCAFGGARGTGVGRHEVSLRVGKKDAEVRRSARGAFDPFGRGREAAFVNLNRDGLPDLFVTNDPVRVDGMPSTNRFFKNVDGKFVPAPGVGLDHSTGARCVWSGDIDKDGDGDILHCVTRPDDGRAAGVRFYRNEGGRLRNRTAARNIKPMGDIAVAVADVTGDGRKDLIQLSQKKIRVSRQTSTGFVRIFQATVSNGVGLAVGDVNKDGRADIYLLRGGRDNTPDRLLISKNKGRHWQNVKIPTTSDGDADAVLAIDHDKNGRMDFLVLNGKSRPGPVQLIAAYGK